MLVLLAALLRNRLANIICVLFVNYERIYWDKNKVYEVNMKILFHFVSIRFQATSVIIAMKITLRVKIALYFIQLAINETPLSKYLSTHFLLSTPKSGNTTHLPHCSVLPSGKSRSIFYHSFFTF